jgi:hypothetical protein
MNKNILVDETDKAKTEYEILKNTYKDLFCSIYEFDACDAYWTGHVLSVADFYFDFYDIMYAVNNQIPEKSIFEWYDYDLILGEHFTDKVSLENYSNGILPYKKKDIELLGDLQSQCVKIKYSIDDLINKMRAEKKSIID